MKYLFLILALALGILANDHEDVERPVAPDQVVFQYIFDGYIREVKPPGINGSTSVQVKFTFAPVRLSMSVDGILKGQIWYRFVWNDPRLGWNPEDMGGFADPIRVDSSLLWIPDIVPYGRLDEFQSMHNSLTPGAWSNALIYPTGEILVVPSVHIEYQCDTNLDDIWAEQQCSLKFGSWTQDGYMLDLQIYENDDNSTGLDMTDYQKSSPFMITESATELVTKYYPCCEEPYPYILFNITGQRRFITTETGIIRNPKLVKTSPMP
eukprot:maker-scaffold1347_size46067-snap-gene-0.10 protein:Tk02969 transcript:maker-scaffold1347_size46067-snap-gene-0.10-mRNA-1 annotation:"neuronal acetylcholine receptor subunit alpha-3 precursor"